jgi:hypothetical protein
MYFIKRFFTQIKRILIWLDQGINVILFFGYQDETLSSRAYRQCRDKNQCIWKNVIDTLLFFDKNHCYESYQSEVLNRHLPPEFRNGS